MISTLRHIANRLLYTPPPYLTVGGRGVGLSDFLFPRYCPICGERLELDERPLCIRCNMDLPRLNLFSAPTDNALAQLFWGKANVERVAAFMTYQPKSDASAVITDTKYHNLATIGTEMGRMIAQEAAPTGFFDGIDALLPVPVSASRRIDRGYNQSEMIAQGVSQVTGIPIINFAVLRTHFNRSQTKLSNEEREENVKDAFHVIYPDALNGKHILVIDDVVTTGATLQSFINEIHRSTQGVTASILTMGNARRLPSHRKPSPTHSIFDDAPLPKITVIK